MMRIFCIFISLLCFSSAIAANPATNTELIQSIPSQTELADPDLKFAKDKWIEMVRGAKKSIDIAQFYASSKPGKALAPVIEELRAALGRGVKVRFLISEDLIKAYQSTVDEIKNLPGVEFAVYDISKVSKGGILHAKYWIIDGQKAFVGSQNFDWRALTEIHELGVITTEKNILRDLKKVFDFDWELARSKTPKSFIQNPTQFTQLNSELKCESGLVASPPSLNPKGIKDAQRKLIALIQSAKSAVKIQLLHYSPVEKNDPKFWPVIDNALRDAATRGVKVTLLLSDWNMEPPAVSHTKSLAEVPNIEIRIATIPQSSEGPIAFARVIHSKYMVVDERSFWLGTSNWSADYFLNSRNVELVFCDEALAKKGSQVFDRLWKSRYSVDVRQAKGSTLFKDES